MSQVVVFGAFGSCNSAGCYRIMRRLELRKRVQRSERMRHVELYYMAVEG